MRIKVLPLPAWATFVQTLKDCLTNTSERRQVKPVFSRPGLYLRGSHCWMELPDGRAFTHSIGAFIFELRMHNAGELNHRQAAALSAIVEAKLATKGQKKLLDDYEEAAIGRKLYRHGMHMHYRFLRKVGKLKWSHEKTWKGQ